MHADTLPIATAGDHVIAMLPRMANRHGLIAGATGTGKTVSLRVLAEQFSRLGVPVFLADVKGDLGGLARPGGDHPKVVERAAQLGLPFTPAACPVAFWDLFGRDGIPIRATVSEMGPLLLARLLGLNDTQAGVLQIAFAVADAEGLLLLDLKDLRALLQHVGTRAGELRLRYGNVSPASLGAIQRGLLTLEQQGGERFFGEPALALDDLLHTDASGAGVINILIAEPLMHTPALYATFLLWLLAELFESLPEVGDPERPRLVFFFDEAHLLFADARAAVQEQIERVVRLIRSKGVGVYFVSQSPSDIPDAVLGQLGHRIQHALRAFTPRDQKAVRSAAETFRPNPALDVARAITELGVGEALISVLDARGTPTPVERAFVHPPRSQLAPLDPAARAALVAASPLRARYGTALDRESAHERLQGRAGAPPPTPPARRGADPLTKAAISIGTSVVRSMGTQAGRTIVRGILGALFGGSRR